MSEKNIPVRVENASKRFRQGDTVVEALKEVTLDVAEGEFLTVMGASGSGKSTLLHLIAGLTRPDAGSISINGEILTGMSDRRLTMFRRRHIGIIFQSFNLIPTLTARDNILLPAASDGRILEAEKALPSLLSRLDLENRISHRPDALSGGEQQRAAIARALINQPAIVLADEPTGSLDSVNGQNLCKLLREMCDKDGRTIILVTHEPSVAIWSKRIVVLKDGRIISSFETSGFKDSHSLASHYQGIVESDKRNGAAA